MLNLFFEGDSIDNYVKVVSSKMEHLDYENVYDRMHIYTASADLFRELTSMEPIQYRDYPSSDDLDVIHAYKEMINDILAMIKRFTHCNNPGLYPISIDFIDGQNRTLIQLE